MPIVGVIIRMLMDFLYRGSCPLGSSLTWGLFCLHVFLIEVWLTHNAVLGQKGLAVGSRFISTLRSLRAQRPSGYNVMA